MKKSIWDLDPNDLFAHADSKRDMISFQVSLFTIDSSRQTKTFPQDVINILKKPSDQRHKKEIFKLDEFFLNSSFFKDLANETDKETSLHCYKVMNHQSHKAGENIFHYGKS